MEDVEGSERVGWGEPGLAGKEVRANLCRNCLGGQSLTNLDFGSELVLRRIMFNETCRRCLTRGPRSDTTTRNWHPWASGQVCCVCCVCVAMKVSVKTRWRQEKMCAYVTWSLRCLERQSTYCHFQS